MNELQHMLAVIHAYEEHQMPLYDMVGELSAAISLMADSYEEKENLRSEWWTLEEVNADMLDKGITTLSQLHSSLVQEAVNNIKQMLAKMTSVEVSFIADVTALYTYGKHQMEIRIEKLSDGVVLDFDTIESWLPPYQEENISDSEKELIQKRISDYLDRQGIVYGWI